jgi:hypothetical protein
MSPQSGFGTFTLWSPEPIATQEKDLKTDLSDRLLSLLALSRTTDVKPKDCIQAVFDSMDELKLSQTLDNLLLNSFVNIKLTNHEQSVIRKFPVKRAYLYIRNRIPLFITRNFGLVEGDPFNSTLYYERFKRYLSDFIGTQFGHLVRIEDEKIYSKMPVQVYNGQSSWNFFAGFIVLEEPNPLNIDTQINQIIVSDVVNAVVVTPPNEKRICVSLRPGDLLIIRGSDKAKFSNDKNFELLYFTIYK